MGPEPQRRKRGHDDGANTGGENGNCELILPGAIHNHTASSALVFLSRRLANLIRHAAPHLVPAAPAPASPASAGTSASQPGAPGSQASAKAPEKPSQPDLITRYNLKDKLSTGAPSGPAESPNGSKAWSSNRDERQSLLQRRRDQMILEARRKMEAKIKAEKTAAASGAAES